MFREGTQDVLVPEVDEVEQSNLAATSRERSIECRRSVHRSHEIIYISWSSSDFQGLAPLDLSQVPGCTIVAVSEQVQISNMLDSSVLMDHRFPTHLFHLSTKRGFKPATAYSFLKREL